MKDERTIYCSSLDGDPTYYVPVTKSCWLRDAVSVIHTAITTNDVTITFSDGTTTIGTITVAVGSAGDVDAGITFDSTSLGKVELNRSTPLNVVFSGTPGAGAVDLTLNFDDFHAT